MAKKRSSRRTSAPERHRGLGFLFWLCLAAIIVAVGFAARGSLQAAFTRVAGGAAGAPAPRVTITPLKEGAPRTTTGPASNAPLAAQPGGPAGVMEKRQPTAAIEKPTMRKTRLFFVSVDPNGRLLMKSVIRPILASDSPLHDALEALLKGPTSPELNGGLLSMIPMDAKLRNVSVRGDTAYVDFSESFRFNTQGTEALNAQLRQVVFAATEFPSVKNVQVLLEGKKVRYLGPEGTRIDLPLSRTSFQP
jgi:germination protein M